MLFFPIWVMLALVHVTCLIVKSLMHLNYYLSMKGQDQHVFFFFRLHFYSSGNEEQQTFSQISSFTPSFDPKYSRNPFTFSHTKGQREWVACREHSKVLGNLMLSGSRVQRPGRPNLLAIWNIIQKFNLHLMRWKKSKQERKIKNEASKGKSLGENKQITKDELHFMHTRVVWYNNLIVSTWFHTATISSDIYSDYIITFTHFEI